jgi:hypothetical protein
MLKQEEFIQTVPTEQAVYLAEETIKEKEHV